MKHTIKNPLKLIWDGSTYKVNKPNQGTQELVSIEIAKELKDALAALINNDSNPVLTKDKIKAIEAYNNSLD